VINEAYSTKKDMGGTRNLEILVDGFELDDEV
jgi:hypothetical protein